MIQGWILEDLHNIKKEKHFPYIHDKEISDPKLITTEEFNKLYANLCWYKCFMKWSIMDKNKKIFIF